MTSTTTTVTTLDPQTLRQWMAQHEDLVIIDVRSGAEFESLHIRGSHNVPCPCSPSTPPTPWPGHDRLAARRPAHPLTPGSARTRTPS